MAVFRADFQKTEGKISVNTPRIVWNGLANPVNEILDPPYVRYSSVCSNVQRNGRHPSSVILLSGD